MLFSIQSIVITHIETLAKHTAQTYDYVGLLELQLIVGPTFVNLI